MILTATQLENTDTDTLSDLADCTHLQYRMTDAELGWLRWIGGRYTIALYIEDNTFDGVVTLGATDVAEALQEDGVDRPPCLSEDSQLCRLIWHMGASY